MEEVWRDVIDFASYEMLIDGTVRNKKAKHILKAYKKKASGGFYYTYVLFNETGPHTKTRHRLIAENYIQNPDNLPEVDHIIPVRNGGTDNISNLRWVNKMDNQLNNLTVEYRNGIYSEEYRENRRKSMLGNEYGKLLGIPLLQMDDEGNILFIWQSTREAERVGGFDHKSISNCCNGIKKHHKGFRWCYL